MSKLVGLKGRSPETYPSHRVSGLVETLANVYSSPVPLGTSLGSILSAAIVVPAGNAAAVIMYSGVLESASPVLVTVEIILNGTTVWTEQIEVLLTNQPFSVVFNTEHVSSAVHTVDIQAYASLTSTATVAAGGSIVVIALPTL